MYSLVLRGHGDLGKCSRVGRIGGFLSPSSPFGLSLSRSLLYFMKAEVALLHCLQSFLWCLTSPLQDLVAELVVAVVAAVAVVTELALPAERPLE